MTLQWRVPFGSGHCKRGSAVVAHLVSMDEWLGKRVCNGLIVNTRLAEKPKPGVKHCVNCKRAEAAVTKPPRHPDRRRPGYRKAA